MEHKWGSDMGRLIYEICKKVLEKPMILLKVLEEAGKVAEEEGRFLSWHVPVTNFPVIQNYTEGIVKKIYVQYGPPAGPRNSTGYYENTLQLKVCFIEIKEPSKNKQSQGASPNTIHSLDAAHLMMVVHEADFGVTTVHDSFGSLLCDVDKLSKIVREQFVKLYEVDPLTKILTEMNIDVSKVPRGTLKINSILDSEYCFL